jgi:hypothetical protein
VGDSVSDGVGGGAAADKDMPNDTKDEIDFLTREITEDERTVAAAASIVDKKRDRLQHLQRMLAPSPKPSFLDEDRMRSFLHDAIQGYMEVDLGQRSVDRPLVDLARITPPAASTALTYRQRKQIQTDLGKTLPGLTNRTPTDPKAVSPGALHSHLVNGLSAMGAFEQGLSLAQGLQMVADWMMTADVLENVFPPELETLGQQIVDGTLPPDVMEGAFVTAVINAYVARGKQAAAWFAPIDAVGTPLGNCYEAVRVTAELAKIPNIMQLMVSQAALSRDDQADITKKSVAAQIRHFEVDLPLLTGDAKTFVPFYVAKVENLAAVAVKLGISNNLLEDATEIFMGKIPHNSAKIRMESSNSDMALRGETETPLEFYGRYTLIARHEKLAAEAAARNDTASGIAKRDAEIAALKKRLADTTVKAAVNKDATTKGAPSKMLMAKAAAIKAKCFNCGEPGHMSERCTLAGRRCYECKLPGHIASACPTKKPAGNE